MRERRRLTARTESPSAADGEVVGQPSAIKSPSRTRSRCKCQRSMEQCEAARISRSRSNATNGDYLHGMGSQATADALTSEQIVTGE